MLHFHDCIFLLELYVYCIFTLITDSSVTRCLKYWGPSLARNDVQAVLLEAVASSTSLDEAISRAQHHDAGAVIIYGRLANALLDVGFADYVPKI